VEFSKYTELRLLPSFSGARPAEHHPGDRKSGAIWSRDRLLDPQQTSRQVEG
jgi:hypothetical protein